MSSGGGGVLKLVNKYLVQAKKLDEVEPVIAYYCRLHAAQVALKQRKSKQDDAVAGELISWCEKHKKAIEGLSKDEARARVETFALDVFATADVEDRQGPITNRTATAFFAAFIFMDVCHQFGDLALDIEQKMKYSAWKATEINRALKEGRTPKPGGVDEEGGGFGGMEDVRGGRGGAAEDQGTAPGGGGFGGASRSGGAGGGGGGGGGVGGFVAGGGSGGFVPDGDGGIAGPRGGSGGGGAGGGKSVSWQQHEDDERMAARYAASLPSAPSAPPSSSEAMDDEKDTSSAPPSSFHPSVFPIHPPSSSSLPSSYLPSSPLPPPLPPQPSSHETAHAFGFTVDGASTSSPTSYTPGFTGPSVPPRPSLPSPSSSPAPSAPSKFPASSAPSPPPSSSRYSPAPASSGGPPALPPVLGKSRVVAVKEADRLMKHAASALSFDDIDTSIAKLQQAVALLYPHKTP